ncbi:MAG: hypothetical protein DI538_22505 [Azospira oryzae]|jgi:hypothetical protein|nr:MAG: hypothetical protein DI538_22505 [Azospira oryzae]
MKVVFNEAFGRVWTDDVSPYVFTLIDQIPPSSAHVIRFFKAQTELAHVLQKKFKEAYLISDFSQAPEETKELLCHYYCELMPQLMKAKIAYLAFICPDTSFESLPKEKREKLSLAPVGIFPDFTEALAMVNLKRSLELAQRFELS